jgi:hypothetical protein
VISEAVAKLVYERGIYMAAFLPIKISEPADKAKNIVGKRIFSMPYKLELFFFDMKIR